MKHHILPTCIPFPRRKLSTIFLAFCWCAGLLLGCFVSQHMDNIHASMMREAASRSVSIVGLFAVLLPFLISAIAVCISQIWLVFPVSFLKAFSFAFVAASVTEAFGSSGWLVRNLLLFTDVFSAPILLGCWLRLLACSPRNALRDCAICAAVCFVVCGFDYFIVSPFLTGLV